MDGVVERWREVGEESYFYARGGTGRRVGGVDAKGATLASRAHKATNQSARSSVKSGSPAQMKLLFVNSFFISLCGWTAASPKLHNESGPVTSMTSEPRTVAVQTL